MMTTLTCTITCHAYRYISLHFSQIIKAKIKMFLDCTPQYTRVNSTIARDATYYFNVTSETECVANCTVELNCVAVDFEYTANPHKCWPHFRHDDIRELNFHGQPGTTLFIPVKRCIAYIYGKQLYK